MTAPFSADLIPTSQWPLLLELIGVAPCVAWFVRDFFFFATPSPLSYDFSARPFFHFLTNTLRSTCRRYFHSDRFLIRRSDLVHALLATRLR